MSSYVYLELDRTPPIIEIYAPSYTTKDLVNEIIIQSNEKSSLSQNEIYAIDSNGDRHEYTFDYMDDINQFVGLIKFSNFPVGIATIYARVRDEVGNMSNRVSKSINIKESLTMLVISPFEPFTRNVSDENASDRNVKIYNRTINDARIEEHCIMVSDSSKSAEIHTSEENMEQEV